MIRIGTSRAARASRALIIACSLLVNGPAVAAVKILVVFDQNAWAATANPEGLADDFRDSAQNVLSASGLSGLQYDLAWHPQPVAFASTPSTSASAILMFMQQMSAVPGSISQLRDQYAADVVVMLVNAYTNSSGGPGSGSTLAVHDTLSNPADMHRKGFVVMTTAAVNQDPPVRPGHELGHVLFAEHETLADSNINVPVQHNHPFIVPSLGSTVVGKQTVMASSNLTCNEVGGGTAGCEWFNFHSDPLRVFPGTTQSAGNVAFQNEKNLIPTTWPIVEQYRTPSAPPPPPLCGVEFTGCISNVPRVLFTYAYPGGVTPTSYAVQRKYGTGSWHNLGSTFVDGCYPQNSVLKVTTQFRVTLNSAYGSSQCQVQIYIGECSDPE